MIKIIDTKESWQRIISEMDNYDFYHTYDYHIISKKSDEQPILMVYEENKKIIAIPFLKRPINGSKYFDLTSVYGYAGPLSKNISKHSFENKKFIKSFNEKMKEMDIISVFSRLNPYIDNQELILMSLGNTPTIGKVVNINLTLDLDKQRTQYGKSTKNRVNKSRKVCSVIKASTDEQINDFIDIYYENMDRVSANKDYYFSRKYFFDFLNCNDFKTEILLVIHNENSEVIAGSMFVKSKNIVQFHLSGTKNAYLNYAPANIFLDEMRVLATMEGYKYFNLGGGLGSKEDSLFKFKSSFSKELKDFMVWEYIVDEKIYNSLSTENSNPTNKDFFPIYRA